MSPGGWRIRRFRLWKKHPGTPLGENIFNRRVLTRIGKQIGKLVFVPIIKFTDTPPTSVTAWLKKSAEPCSSIGKITQESFLDLRFGLPKHQRILLGGSDIYLDQKKENDRGRPRIRTKRGEAEISKSVMPLTKELSL